MVLGYRESGLPSMYERTKNGAATGKKRYPNAKPTALVVTLPSGAARLQPLKRESRAELDVASAHGDVVNRGRARIANIGVRSSEARMVQHVGGIQPKL